MEYLKKIRFKYLVLMVLASIPLFGYLGTLPIRLWDESRQAINAFEMYKNGNFIVTYFQGCPDMWNTKPPLLVWLQVALMKVIGANELAIRLPSALAGFLTCGVIFIFAVRYLKNFWLGFLGVVVLVSSQGYIDEHVVRTGDYDALLTLFTTLMGLFAFIYIESKQSKYLYVFFGVSTLAVLTKGVAGLLFLPGIFLFVLFQKELIFLLKNKHFYLAVLLFLSIVIGYYLSREFYNEGYIKAVWDNELGGRYMATTEGHNAPFWFYIDNIISKDLLFIYSVLLPAGCLSGLRSQNERLKRFFKFIFLVSLSFLLIISLSKTKLKWYEVPLYPWFAFFIASFIEYDFRRLLSYFRKKKRPFLMVAPYFFLVLVTLIPYLISIKRVYKPKEHERDISLYEVSYYLRDALMNGIDLNNQTLLIEECEYRPVELFYVELLKDKGVNISVENLEEMKVGQIVFTGEGETNDFIRNNYLHTVLYSKGSIVTYKLHGKK